MPEQARPAKASLAGGPVAQPGVKAKESAAPAEQDTSAAAAASLGYMSIQAAAGAAPPPPRFGLTPGNFLALQRMVGNRAIAGALERMNFQRVAVPTTFSETLYTGEDKKAPGQAVGGSFGQGGQYQITRDGNAGATVEVKIRFMRQHRNTMKPRPGTSDPEVGQLAGRKTELPAGDQTWATQTANAAMAHWAGRLTFVGKDKPAPDAAEVDKRLPVTFKATAVFHAADAADQEVIVHPPNVVGGSTGNPIDSGNFYMKKNDSIYPDTDDQIYAHEYGHLLGIPDEYSQSNEQINQLIHRAAPGTAASSVAALDKKTVELMVLATLTKPLVGRLHNLMAPINAAIRAQKKQVKAKMVVATREAVRSPEVADLLKSRLGAMSDARLAPRIARAVAVETTTNFAHGRVATDGVDSILSGGSVSKLLESVYRDALAAPQDEPVAVPSFGSVKIEVQSSIANAAFKKGALQTAVKGVAADAVGPPGLPKLLPPSSLAGQLAAIPATWGGAGGAIEGSITPAALQAKILAGIEAATVTAVAPPPPGATARPAIRSNQALFGKAWALINNAARSAVKLLAADLVIDTMDPVLEKSVADVRANVANEVNKVMGGPPSALTSAPPDPNMAKIVADMKGRLDAAKTALAGTGMDPMGVTGGTTPAQDVTYSYQGLMGAGATTEMRPDQFQPMADKFNANLKYPTEQNFKPETKSE